MFKKIVVVVVMKADLNSFISTTIPDKLKVKEEGREQSEIKLPREKFTKSKCITFEVNFIHTVIVNIKLNIFFIKKRTCFFFLLIW